MTSYSNASDILSRMTTVGIDLLSTINNGSDEEIGPTADPAYIDFRDKLRFWVTLVLVPIIVTIGIVGNTVTIVVLTQRRMRSSTNLYLTALAISDMLYLIFSFTLSLIRYPQMNTLLYLQYHIHGGVMLTDVCSNTSVWLTVSFTIERYVAVCHPIRGKALCTESRAKVVIATVFVFAFVSALPTPFVQVVVEVENPPNNESLYIVEDSPLGKDQIFSTAFNWYSILLFTLIPLTLLAIFNSFLILAVHRSKQQRRKMTSVRGDRQDASSSQETRITIMLIAVVVLFLLCQVPTSIILYLQTYHSVDQQTPNQMTIFAALGNVCNFLMAVNASCNFMLYCAFSDKYRKTFLVTFLRCCYRSSSSPHHSQSVYYRSTVVESTTLSRSPSCLERSPSSHRSFSRANSNRSRGRGSVRSVQDGSVRSKQRYLTVPNGDPNGCGSTADSSPRNSPTPPPQQEAAPDAASPGRRSVMMCFRLPKGPLRILGSRKKSTDSDLRSQSVPLTRPTEHTITIDAPTKDKDKFTSL